MAKNLAANIVLDLSKKTPDEIAEFLQALLAARHALLAKGHKIKISRRKPVPVFGVSR